MSQAYRWSPDAVGVAMTQLARHTGLLRQLPTSSPTVTDGATPASAAALGTQVEQIAEQLGLEAEAVYATYREVAQLVQQSAPALLWLSPVQEDKETRRQGDKEIVSPRGISPSMLVDPDAVSPSGVLVLLKGGRRRVTLLTPELAVHQVAAATVCDWLCQAWETQQQALVTPLLDRLALPASARRQTQRALLHQQIGQQRVVEGWLLRLAPNAPLRQQLRQAQIQRPLAQLLGSYLAQLGLIVASWWLIGGSALQGYVGGAGLWAWALLLLTSIPCRLWTEQAQQAVSEALSLLSKQRLLYGILRLSPEEIRHQGAGQFFGQVMEADSLDNLALGGGLVAGLALIQAGLALLLLRLAAPMWLLPLLLLGWLLLIGGLTGLYLYRQRRWLATYRSLSSDLVERMVGHRTRLQQELRSHWHEEEDAMLAHYTDQTQRVDWIKSWLTGNVTRGWMVVALGGLLLTVWRGAVNLPLALAGILLALQALTNITNGVISLANAIGVWEQVRPLFQAAKGDGETGRQGDRETGRPFQGRPGVAAMTPSLPLPVKCQAGQPLLMAHGVEFRYHAGGRAIVREGNLQIRQGDRWLLQGASGSGKSTLAALLAGLRTPDTGLLLLHGLDPQSVGVMRWRQRVILTPQFHENHIFSAPLAFNLLMGRRWPPTTADLQAATTLCQELGLGPLLERMPAGLHQMVGESGWRLSHGERSRVYMARALLQQADLLLLDESFAALDPATMRIALACALRHAPTLFVIAHP